ncbi:DUF2771 domain-containing protein [Streptomyces sp. NPDC051569]|uniref:DUF2771 domain-containing protein n=1 Tax=Streptomyces sp. NPDC051569 TaxID=3365661 RepID=UPI0037A55096
MTVAFFPGKARRAGVALGAVSAGLLVLAACDKPTPIATVTVGTTSVNTGASCYNDGHAISETEIQSCLNKKAEKTVNVSMEDQVRFGVDPTIAHHGWTLFINGQQAEQQPFTKTYRNIPGNAFFATQTGETTNDTQVSIVETDGKELIGIWHFEFKKKP